MAAWLLAGVELMWGNVEIPAISLKTAILSTYKM